MSHVAGETLQLSLAVDSTAESVNALYFTLNGIPNTSNLFAKLQAQLQAMMTVLRLLDGVPDAVALDTNVVSLVEKFGKSCTEVKNSITQFSHSEYPDWTAFRDGQEDVADITRKLHLYTACIVIGGLQDLSSKGYIIFSAAGQQEYEELLADARIALEEHSRDLLRRAESLVKQ